VHFHSPGPGYDVPPVPLSRRPSVVLVILRKAVPSADICVLKPHAGAGHELCQASPM